MTTFEGRRGPSHESLIQTPASIGLEVLKCFYDRYLGVIWSRSSLPEGGGDGGCEDADEDKKGRGDGGFIADVVDSQFCA